MFWVHLTASSMFSFIGCCDVVYGNRKSACVCAIADIHAVLLYVLLATAMSVFGASLNSIEPSVACASEPVQLLCSTHCNDRMPRQRQKAALMTFGAIPI